MATINLTFDVLRFKELLQQEQQKIQKRVDLIEKTTNAAIKDEILNPEEFLRNNKFRSTVFILGKDKRVGTKVAISPPALNFAEIKESSLGSPFIELNFNIERSVVESSKIVGFKIFRKQITREDAGVKFSKFNKDAFDLLSEKLKKSGKFSEERKGIYSISRSLIDRSVLNINLYETEQSAVSRQLSELLGDNSDQSSYSTQAKTNNETSSNFVQVAFVNYSNFLNQLQKRQVFVNDQNLVELSFRDERVGYGQIYEYYIVSVSSNSEESSKSSSIIIPVQNLNSISAPTFLTAKQVNEKKIILNFGIERKDRVILAYIFRRAEDEVNFSLISTLQRASKFIDEDIAYGKTYSYRVILENIHGIISDPKDIQITSSSQRTTNRTRSNTLQIPIFSAIQDQDSDSIKISISHNDSRVSYYIVDRRDLTSKETLFTIPSKANLRYRLNGWDDSILLVKKEQIDVAAALDLNSQQIVSGQKLTTNLSNQTATNDLIQEINQDGVITKTP